MKWRWKAAGLIDLQTLRLEVSLLRIFLAALSMWRRCMPTSKPYVHIQLTKSTKVIFIWHLACRWEFYHRQLGFGNYHFLSMFWRLSVFRGCCPECRPDVNRCVVSTTHDLHFPYKVGRDKADSGGHRCVCLDEHNEKDKWCRVTRDPQLRARNSGKYMVLHGECVLMIIFSQRNSWFVLLK